MQVKNIDTESMEKRCTIKHHLKFINFRQGVEGRKATRDKGGHTSLKCYILQFKKA